MNLKVEKAFKLGDTSRMYFSIDLFNVLNLDTIMRKYDISLGSFRYAGNDADQPHRPQHLGQRLRQRQRNHEPVHLPSGDAVPDLTHTTDRT